MLITDQERDELMRENYEDAVQLTVQEIRAKTAGDHYQSCIRHIQGGQEQTGGAETAHVGERV